MAHIDDRLDHLNGFDITKRVWYHTRYEQSVNCGVGYQIESWEKLDINNFIEYLENINA